MHVTKTAKAIGILALSIASGACSSELVYPKDYPSWTVSIAQSYVYGAAIEKIYGVNEKEDWTSFFHTLSRNEYYRIKDVRHALGDYTYNGVEVSLGKPKIGKQIMPTTSLPDQVYVYWSAYDSGNDYISVLDVTEDMKKVMLTPHPHPRGVDYPCYQNSFMFGLFPNGQAKVWLSGCRIYTYVGELEPKSVKVNSNPLMGEQNRSVAVGKQVGLENVLPVPNEVYQVLYDKKRFTMNTLEEALNESKRDH